MQFVMALKYLNGRTKICTIAMMNYKYDIEKVIKLLPIY
jgi:hypothetical protein